MGVGASLGVVLNITISITIIIISSSVVFPSNEDDDTSSNLIHYYYYCLYLLYKDMFNVQYGISTKKFCRSSYSQ